MSRHDILKILSNTQYNEFIDIVITILFFKQSQKLEQLQIVVAQINKQMLR